MNKGRNTLAIKASLTNKLRKAFYNAEKKRIFTPDEITNEVALRLFDIIRGELSLTHDELNSLKSKNKRKNKVHALRVANGYYIKKQLSREGTTSEMRTLQEEIKRTPERRGDLIAAYRSGNLKGFLEITSGSIIPSAQNQLKQ